MEAPRLLRANSHSKASARTLWHHDDGSKFGAAHVRSHLVASAVQQGNKRGDEEPAILPNQHNEIPPIESSIRDPWFFSIRLERVQRDHG